MKKKLLIAIANYGENQEKYLMQMLKEFNTFKKYEISIILLNTKKLKNLKYSNLKIQQKIFPLEITHDLPHQHRKYFFEEKDNFDLFLYTENNLLIKEKNIDYFLSEMDNLKKTNFIPGFILYEENESGEKVLPNITPEQGGATRKNFIKLFWMFLPKVLFRKLGLLFEKSFILKRKYEINGRNYFEIQNNHQAFYIVTKKQLIENIIPNRKKIKRKMYCSPKVTAASFPYFKEVSGLIKILPVDNLDDALVHHLPNKYLKDSKFHYPLKKLKSFLK